MDNESDDLTPDTDLSKYARATDPDALPGPHGETPDWFTDMDLQILHVLSFGHILTPAIIAENIDRSRGAVSRRLQTLQAGGFVEKVSRGKYTINNKGHYTAWGEPLESKK